MNKKRMIMKKLKKNKATIIKNAVTIALPVSAVAVCLVMGMKTDDVEKTPDLNTIAYTTTASTTSLHITYTMLTTSTTTSTTADINSDRLTLNAVSLGYTESTSVNYEWYMYGNSMPVVDEYGNICTDKYGNICTIYVESNLLANIYKECRMYNVPFAMALAVCYVESHFGELPDNVGINSDGSHDYGFMALNSTYLDTYYELYNNGIPFDVSNDFQNTHIGIQILASNIKNYIKELSEHKDFNIEDFADMNNVDITDYNFNDIIYNAANAYNLGIVGWNDMKISDTCRGYGYCDNYGNWHNGDWNYGKQILNYMNVLYNMPTDNSTDYFNEDWSVD